MDLLTHAVQAYNFLLVLVDIILGTFLGGMFGLGGLAILFLAMLAVGVALVRRRAGARQAKTPPP
jgi:hypothetical protein